MKNTLALAVINAARASLTTSALRSIAARTRLNPNWNHAGTNRMAMVARVQYSGFPGSTSQPNTNSRKVAGSTRLRRRLSRIFHCETREMGFGTSRPDSSGTRDKQPARDLPVAAQPAMLAAVVGAVVRGIVFDDLDVAGQSGARVGAFDQVMTEQGVARETAIENAVHRVHFVDTLAGEDAFAIQILIHIRDGASIDIETGLSGIEAGQPGTGGTLDTHSDPRLQDAIACYHDVLLRIDDGLVEGMGHRPNHAVG